MKPTISPSILNSDLGDLRGQLRMIAGADLAHVDVMDNHFVPNLTWGLPVVQACVDAGILPVDAHLMIEDPDRWAPAYAEVGCASVTFHAEAAAAPVRLAREIRHLGARVGLGLRPATDISAYVDLLPEFDTILVMTVEPGFGGQSFLTSMLTKIRRTREAVTFSGVAPMFSSASTRARCPSRPFQKDLSPSETPVSALPMSMPLIGMRYCGSNTLCPTIQVTKNMMMPSPQLAMETDTITRKRGLSLLLRESTR